MNDTLRLPVFVTISGHINFTCQDDLCSELVSLPIEDVVKPGMGGDLISIQDQADESHYRCADCREIYLAKLAREWDND